LSGARNGARALLALCVVLGFGACRARKGAEVYVIAGPEPQDHVEFRPVASYAEFLVLPGERRELRLTLASYATSCDSFVEPSDTDASATVTVISPTDAELGPGSYVWAGHVAHGGTEQQPERAYALPTIRLGHRSMVLPAGGEIQLDSVATTQDGRVRGLLAFEFAGDADHVATSLKGSFEARLCRARL
jgi:hypothetical protein